MQLQQGDVWKIQRDLAQWFPHVYVAAFLDRIAGAAVDLADDVAGVASNFLC